MLHFLPAHRIPPWSTTRGVGHPWRASIGDAREHHRQDRSRSRTWNDRDSWEENNTLKEEHTSKGSWNDRDSWCGQWEAEHTWPDCWKNRDGWRFWCGRWQGKNEGTGKTWWSSDGGQQEQTVRNRLETIDALLREGIVSEEEHYLRRQKILDSI